MNKRRFTAFLCVVVLLMGMLTACSDSKKDDKAEAKDTTPSVTAETEPTLTTEPTCTPTAEPTAAPTAKPTTEPEEEISLEELHESEFSNLKDAYADYFMLGTIYTDTVRSGSDYALVTTNFNVITAENLMKPEGMQPTEGKFNYAPADRMLSWAKENSITVHGHVLAWHQQSGNWLGKTTDRDKAIAQLKAHIEGVAGHYDGQIYSWDVVNEAIQDGATLPADGDWTKCLRATQWTSSIGTDYIALAFQFAREAAPNAKLYYNDYNMDDPKKAAIAAAMVADLKKQGIPIDGIGMQGHYNTDTSINRVEASLNKFSQIEGIVISVSELDVGVSGVTSGKLTKAQELKQAVFYARLFDLYKKYADVIERVTFWGYKDSTSWRSETAPLLFTSALAPKEAYYAVLNPEGYLDLDISAYSEVKTKNAEAVKGTPTIDGQIDSCWSTATKYEINTCLYAWQGAKGTVSMLWDENNFYALIEVEDSDLNASSANKYEQDSIEFFLDPNNCKDIEYDSLCGQYRCNYKGDTSFGTVPTTTGFEAKAVTKTGGYVVELRIPLSVTAKIGMTMGFDAQINDSNKSGVRQSIRKFNANTDDAYTNPSLWANVTLK